MDELQISSSPAATYVAVVVTFLWRRRIHARSAEQGRRIDNECRERRFGIDLGNIERR